jgi:predicted AAA+ superfamily ATPase
MKKLKITYNSPVILGFALVSLGVLVLKEGNEKKEYLKNLFQTTYFRDILEHNKLKKMLLWMSCAISSAQRQVNW